MLIEVKYKNKVVLRVDTTVECSEWVVNQMKMYKRLRQKDRNLRITQLKEKSEEWIKAETEWQDLMKHFEGE